MSRGRRKVVCSFCRKRKIKCDMASPCGPCVRFGNPDCDLAEIAGASGAIKTDGRVSKPERSTTDVEILKERLILLESLIAGMAGKSLEGTTPEVADEAASDGLFSFHRQVGLLEYLDLNGLRLLGSLRWLVPMSLDDGLRKLGTQIAHMKKLQHNPEVVMRPDLLLNLLLCSAPSACLQASSFRSNKDLRVQIQELLPSKKRTWMLIDRFFNVIYPYVPALDEIDFRDAISAIIGPKTFTEDPVEVASHDENDYALLGMLLVVVRITYLSLFDNRNKLRTLCFYNSASEMAYLSELEIVGDCITVAESCLKEYDLVRDIKLECIQLLTLIRTYMMNDPESPNPDIQNLTYSAILNSLSYSRWLNREPRKMFNVDTMGYRKTQLLRKLWYTVLNLEFVTAVFSGNAPSIDLESYDVQLPQFRANGLNIEDTKLDAAVCNSFFKFAEVRNLLAEALKYSSRIAGPVRVSDVEAVVKKLEIKEQELYETVLEHSKYQPHNVADAFMRVSEFHSFIMVYFVLVGFYTHLYYYYCRHNMDIANNYRKKFVTVLSNHFLPFLPLILAQDKYPFAGTTDLVTSSLFSHCVIQTVVLLWAMYIDFKTQLHYVQIRPSLLNDLVSGQEYLAKFAALSSASDLIFQILTTIANGITMTLSRYKINSKILRGHGMILKIVSAPGYFEKNSVLTHDLAPADFVNEVNNILNFSLQEESFTGLMPQESMQLMTPSPSLSSSQLVNSFSQFEPNFNLLLFEDLFSV